MPAPSPDYTLVIYWCFCKQISTHMLQSNCKSLAFDFYGWMCETPVCIYAVSMQAFATNISSFMKVISPGSTSVFCLFFLFQKCLIHFINSKTNVSNLLKKSFNALGGEIFMKSTTQMTTHGKAWLICGSNRNYFCIYNLYGQPSSWKQMQLHLIQ